SLEDERHPGFATTAAKRGKSLDAIMRQTLHRSERVGRTYIRHAKLFDDDAAGGLFWSPRSRRSRHGCRQRRSSARPRPSASAVRVRKTTWASSLVFSG